MYNISIDRNYILAEDRITDLKTGIAFTLDNAHPAIVCEMFKSQFSHSYKFNLMERVELVKNMNVLIHKLLEHDRNTLMEYHVRFGFQVLTEEVTYGSIKYIEECWDFAKKRMLDLFPLNLSEGSFGDWASDMWDKGTKAVSSAYKSVSDTVSKGYDYVSDKVKKGYDYVSDKVKDGIDWVSDKVSQAVSYLLNKGLPWFFEKLENFLLSPVGIGIDVALTAIGVGKIASAIIWGSLGVWKIYQLFSGKIENDIWAYVDIGICLMGLLLTGGAAKSLKLAVQGTGRSVSKLMKLPGIKQLMSVIKSGATAILNGLGKVFDWIGKIFGGRAQSMINTVKTKLNSVLEGLKRAFSSEGKGLGQTVKSGVKQDIINPAKAALKSPATIRKAAGKGVTWGTAFYGLEKGIERGAEAYYGVDQTQMQNLQTMNSAIKDKYGDQDPFDVDF